MSEPRERDEAVDRWLRRAKAAPPGAGPGAACLDAETVAAWADGALSAEALRVARAHAADCQRCQVLLAVVQRLETGDQAARAADRRGTSRRWLGWLVPLAAAAGAVAIWVYVPRGSSPAVEEGAAPVAETAQASNAARAAEEKPEAGARPAEPTQALVADAKRQAREKERDEARGADATSAQALRDRAAAPAAAAPPPPTTVTAETPVGRLEQFAARSLATSLDVASPDPLVRWRIRGAVVERTSDGGKSWDAAATGLTGAAADLTAGAAPAANICWLVGRGGVVLLTTDGRTWKRIAFPEATDLSAIRATDAQRATVTAADGREFVTVDGGATWTRRVPA